MLESLWETIKIVFLLVLTLFLFSFLIEYVRMLWLRHKAKKANKELNEIISKIIKKAEEDAKDEKDVKRIKKDIEKSLKEQGATDINIEVVKLKEEPKKRGRKPKKEIK